MKKLLIVLIMALSCQEAEEPKPELINDSYCVYRKKVSTNAQVPSYWELHTCIEIGGYVNSNYKYIETVGCNCPDRL